MTIRKPLVSIPWLRFTFYRPNMQGGRAHLHQLHPEDAEEQDRHPCHPRGPGAVIQLTDLPSIYTPPPGEEISVEVFWGENLKKGTRKREQNTVLKREERRKDKGDNESYINAGVGEGFRTLRVGSALLYASTAPYFYRASKSNLHNLTVNL